MDITNKIIDYENGELTVKECIELFQELLNTGLINQLQGHYGRVAMNLIDAGIIVPQVGKDNKNG